VQLNLFDPEPGFVNNSTYLGKKRTIAVGASLDMQPWVDTDSEGNAADYLFFSADLFLEQPLGPGALTLEGCFAYLDLGSADQLASTEKSAKQAQGKGFFSQIGYFFYNFQPWFGIEKWDSDAETNRGSYSALRAGVSYFIKGHNANLKLGYETFRTEQGIGETSKTRIDTYILGLFVNY
jgi:hypothetical protein